MDNLWRTQVVVLLLRYKQPSDHIATNTVSKAKLFNFFFFKAAADLPDADDMPIGPKRLGGEFDREELLSASRETPVVSQLPTKPAVNSRFALFTAPDGESGAQSDEFCLPDPETGECRW